VFLAIGGGLVAQERGKKLLLILALCGDTRSQFMGIVKGVPGDRWRIGGSRTGKNAFTYPIDQRLITVFDAILNLSV